jgi:protein farnesyltransferase subunit beta
MADSENLLSSIPSYFREVPSIVDSLETETSKLQDATLKECLPLLRALADPNRNPFDFNAFGIPALEREDHVGFLHDNLEEFPAPFVGIDASRPWMVYWALAALYMLGEDITSFRSRYYPFSGTSKLETFRITNIEYLTKDQTC